jgi:hypothetical protein
MIATKPIIEDKERKCLRVQLPTIKLRAVVADWRGDGYLVGVIAAGRRRGGGRMIGMTAAAHGRLMQTLGLIRRKPPRWNIFLARTCSRQRLFQIGI